MKINFTNESVSKKSLSPATRAKATKSKKFGSLPQMLSKGRKGNNFLSTASV